MDYVMRAWTLAQSLNPTKETKTMKLTAYVANGPHSYRKIADEKGELANWLRINCPDDGGVTIILDSGQSKTELVEVHRASYCASMDAYEFACCMFNFGN